MTPRAAPLALVAAVALAACGGARSPAPDPGPPLRVGPGRAFMAAARGAAAAAGWPIGRLGCTAAAGGRVGAHLEVFARRRVVLIPAGIGMAPPLVHDRAYVRSARCSYPVRTREPTGLLELDPRAGPLTLRDLFAIWGQPLSRTRVAAFRGPVRAFAAGRRWPGDPRTLPLHRHAVVVLEVGGAVPPHRAYSFPPGL